MPASYTKLKSGAWGIRVQGSAKEGDSILVTKKDGGTKTETVTKVVWTGNGASLCAIAERQTARSGSYASDTVKCRHCGKRTRDGDDWCDHCGRADYE